MTFWTLLVLTYGAGQWADYQSAVVLPPAACEQALRAAAGPFLKIFPDGAVQCVPLGIPYSSPRPKARPEGLK